MPIPTAVSIELTDEERALLESFTRRHTSAQALALRARMVLAAADGLTNGEIAERLGVSRPTVTKWRRRFAESRVDGLLDEPRPGRPRTITDEQVEAVVVKTLESTPTNATHWSTRSMAAEMRMSQNAIVRIWQAFGLQPHRQERWKLSKDPLFVDKLYDICGLYPICGRDADEPERDRADLAGVRAATAPPGALEALQGPVVRGQALRHLRPVSDLRPRCG